MGHLIAILSIWTQFIIIIITVRHRKCLEFPLAKTPDSKQDGAAHHRNTWRSLCFNFWHYSQVYTSWSCIKGLMEQSVGAHPFMLQKNESTLQKVAWFYVEVHSGEENFLPLLDRAWIMQTENKGRDEAWKSLPSCLTRDTMDLQSGEISPGENWSG